MKVSIGGQFAGEVVPPEGEINLDIQILVDLDSSSENENPLCQICKLPHVPNAIEEAPFLWRLDSLHLLSASFSRHHYTKLPLTEDALLRRNRSRGRPRRNVPATGIAMAERDRIGYAREQCCGDCGCIVE